ncbi:hypothetical protein LQ757_18915 [Agromyces sp. SYSU K20354]|uniref:hypothetical protein n=1 Tax=Agromyces cavernae TaxID=2898659 RepID=UPI001E5688B8|nr:hypothetical protein [Agromyces cavernae]MCD2444357.1 hypothetical protein [Agromyces cavernae]
MAGSRPGGVTLVAVLAWISGALQILGGILVLVLHTDVPGGTTAAWVSIIIGVITILVSLGLFRGSNVARVIVTIVFVLNLAAAIWVMVAVPAQLWSAVIGGLAALIGLILLYSARANEFFRA